ncbi:unnamed protein product [Pararhodospirillum photometricum DSM 122]|uniref:Uncharacterized protein n=1 Tax=Pararhodospirillum photometricum DSM 122 TaxID=1150469 RepID=H6SMN9_PARPM|nr:unnamed protein product [Pararhodospirillum photometricum DSM 122]
MPGSEPSVWELIDDPIGALVRQRDAIEVADVLAAVNAARSGLTRGETRTCPMM